MGKQGKQGKQQKGNGKRDKKSHRHEPSQPQHQQDADVGGKNKGKKKNKGGRNKSNSVVEDIELARLLADDGYIIRSMAADGNCLFRSIADQLHDNPSEHVEYRKRIMRYIKQNKEHFQFFIEDDESFEDYVSRLQNNNEWGGNLELYAASQCLNISIVIHQLDAPNYVIQAADVQRNGHREIHLSYHGECHYNSVHAIGEDAYSSSSTKGNKKVASNKGNTVQQQRKRLDDNITGDTYDATTVAAVQQAVSGASEAYVRTALQLSKGSTEDAIEWLCANIYAADIDVDVDKDDTQAATHTTASVHGGPEATGSASSNCSATRTITTATSSSSSGGCRGSSATTSSSDGASATSSHAATVDDEKALVVIGPSSEHNGCGNVAKEQEEEEEEEETLRQQVPTGTCCSPTATATSASTATATPGMGAGASVGTGAVLVGQSSGGIEGSEEKKHTQDEKTSSNEKQAREGKEQEEKEQEEEEEEDAIVGGEETKENIVARTNKHGGSNSGDSDSGDIVAVGGSVRFSKVKVKKLATTRSNSSSGTLGTGASTSSKNGRSEQILSKKERRALDKRLARGQMVPVPNVESTVAPNPPPPRINSIYI